MSIASPSPPTSTTFVNPLAKAPLIAVTAVGEAEGSRGAAAALACAGADIDVATLLVDVGGRAPRPTLIASAAARQLEERLRTHLPGCRVAARGQVCHLVAPADLGGLAAAGAAASVAREAAVVLHVPSETLQDVAGGGGGLCPGGILLRADLARDRALVALAVRDLMRRGLAVAVLKDRLPWISERRAWFGIHSSGLPSSALRLLG